MKRFIPYILIGFLVQSCLTNKPDSRSMSRPDYNGRIRITKPHYIKKTNAIGHAVVAGSTIGGALISKQIGLIQKQNGEFTSPNNPANLALGALVGFSTSTLCHYLMGKNKEISFDNPQNWLKKANNQYVYYQDAPGTAFFAIPKKSEFNYICKDLNDFKGFHNSFPNSPNKDNVYSQALSNVSRFELPLLLDIDKNTPYSRETKLKYYETSTSVTQLIEADELFPKLRFDKISKGIELTRSYSDLELMLNHFPDSPRRSLFLNSLKSKYDNREVLLLKRKLSEENYFLNETDFGDKPSALQAHYHDFLVKLYNPKSLNEFGQLFATYSWLNYEGYSDFILNHVWNYLDSKYYSGDIILKEYSKFSSIRENLYIPEQSIYNFLEKKLQVEVDQHINLTNTMTLDTRNNDFERWENSIMWDAPYISSYGDIKFLYYGEVTNSSKFDLPLKLNFGSTLLSEVSVDMLNLFDAVMEQKIVGVKEQAFQIPLIRSGETQPFAVLFDFGKGTQAEGLNILGVQGKQELKLESISVEKSIYTNPISPIKREEQQYWMKMVNAGLPSNPIKDIGLWGSTNYEPDSYDESWAEFKRDIAEAAIAALNDPGSSNETYEIIAGEDNMHINIEPLGDNCPVSVIDGGFLWSNVNTENYKVSFTPLNKVARSYKKTSSNPNKDYYCEAIPEIWPLRVSISYIKNNKTKYCELILRQPLKYTINIE